MGLPAEFGVEDNRDTLSKHNLQGRVLEFPRGPGANSLSTLIKERGQLLARLQRVNSQIGLLERRKSPSSASLNTGGFAEFESKVSQIQQGG